MARVRDRDVAAFEALYDAYHRLVYGIAWRMLGDRAAAEDVTQFVLLKIWNAPHTFPGGNVGSWLARVTRDRVLDVLRSQSVRQGAIPTDVPVELEVEETVFASLDGEHIRSALAELPHELRDLIELGFFGGVTHEEIARMMAMPLRTVKTRVRAGLRKLRISLKADAS